MSSLNPPTASQSTVSRQLAGIFSKNKKEIELTLTPLEEVMPTSEVIILPTCTICRDEDGADMNLGITTCGHAFHSQCIEDWNKNQRRLGRRTVCPCCNHNISHAAPLITRIHQLTKHRVSILPDGDHSDPVEELKTATKKLEKLESDKTKLTTENKALKAKNNKLIQESKKWTEESKKLAGDVSHVLKEKVENQALEIEKEKQLRHRQLHALYLGEKKRLLRQLEDSKEAYENLQVELEPTGLSSVPVRSNSNVPAELPTPTDEQIAGEESHSSSNISIGVKRPRPSNESRPEKDKGKAVNVIEIDTDSENLPSSPPKPASDPTNANTNTSKAATPGPSTTKSSRKLSSKKAAKHKIIGASSCALKSNLLATRSNPKRASGSGSRV
ncbi:hypothetical protein H4Q26_017546 [Puccinia striiformis f. sp. tritici PST-130]|nr:hypothetical protein H4Q26_017546 [Puccinia striiformis f. sp. tritici PST-130]